MSGKLSTLCTRCLKPVDLSAWPEKMTWAGEPCTREEYIANALRSERVWIVCDKCLEEMPDVKLEDLRCDN